MKFSELPIIPPLQKALERQGFTDATEIQEKVIPAAIHDHDILGTAQTGSGKTLAFVLPILQNLYNQRVAKNLPDGKIKRNIQALILAPTRELAVQIGETLAPYCTNTNMKHTVIFG
jgi:ATP-dependent RNA helicase RhlE